jgi:hypothetical protein
MTSGHDRAGSVGSRRCDDPCVHGRSRPSNSIESDRPSGAGWGRCARALDAYGHDTHLRIVYLNSGTVKPLVASCHVGLTCTSRVVERVHVQVYVVVEVSICIRYIYTAYTRAGAGAGVIDTPVCSLSLRHLSSCMPPHQCGQCGKASGRGCSRGESVVAELCRTSPSPGLKHHGSLHWFKCFTDRLGKDLGLLFCLWVVVALINASDERLARLGCRLQVLSMLRALKRARHGCDGQAGCPWA